MGLIFPDAAQYVMAGIGLDRKPEVLDYLLHQQR